jgi:hypothetical protein
MPRFASLPALADERLAADLDRVMTVEKGLLASVTGIRQRGVASDADAQVFTEFLGRKRTRAALPDDFTSAVARMRGRILDKHDRTSREGEFLRAVKEIRVRGIPDWVSAIIEVEFLFIFDNGRNIPDDADHWISQLMALVTIDDRIVAVDGRPAALEQLSAARYLSTCRLDLDHLSQGI